jgi:hypothetical protein
MGYDGCVVCCAQHVSRLVFGGEVMVRSDRCGYRVTSWRVLTCLLMGYSCWLSGCMCTIWLWNALSYLLVLGDKIGVGLPCQNRVASIFLLWGRFSVNFVLGLFICKLLVMEFGLTSEIVRIYRQYYGTCT